MHTFLSCPIITKETLYSVKEEAADADTLGLLIEREGAVLDQIVGGRNLPWVI